MDQLSSFYITNERRHRLTKVHVVLYYIIYTLVENSYYIYFDRKWEILLPPNIESYNDMYV